MKQYDLSKLTPEERVLWNYYQDKIQYEGVIVSEKARKKLKELQKKASTR